MLMPSHSCRAGFVETAEIREDVKVFVLAASPRVPTRLVWTAASLISAANLVFLAFATALFFVLF